jgi:hypothetical protein
MKFIYPLAPLFLAEITQTHLLKNQLDSVLYYTQQAISENELFNNSKWQFPLYLLATIQSMKGDFKPALENYRAAIPLAIQIFLSFITNFSAGLY